MNSLRNTAVKALDQVWMDQYDMIQSTNNSRVRNKIRRIRNAMQRESYIQDLMNDLYIFEFALNEGDII